MGLMELVEIPKVILFINTGLLVLFFIVWNIRDTVNCIFKVLLLIIAGCNVIYLLRVFGYVIQAGGGG